jgi:hypothetical protein
MTHPETPLVTRATFDTNRSRLTVDAQPEAWWPLSPEQAALGPSYPLVAQLYDITGRWHVIPEPKAKPGQLRAPARNATSPEPGVVVVDCEEVHPPEG